MSTDWLKTKEELNKVRDELDKYRNNQLPTEIATLKKYLTAYVMKGGVSKNPSYDRDYSEIRFLYERINGYKAMYGRLNSVLSEKIKAISTAGDMGKILQENGVLQSEVSSLEKQLKESEDDVKSAELRDELLRSKDGNITKHQVFMLGRPLRPSSIPYLWALSILFIGASLLVFQTQGPPLLVPLMEWFSMSGPMLFFTGPRLWMILSGALAIVILFLSLRVANVI
jgi:hypothetical protein